MLLKLIGSAFVLASTTMVGIQIANRFKERPEQLRQLQSGLQMLETHIVYRATPLPIALQQVAQCIEGNVGQIFKLAAEKLETQEGVTANEAWHQAVDGIASQLSLASSDREIIVSLGSHLGQSDRDDQVKHLRLIQEHLLMDENKAREEREKNERMWKYLGVYGGLAIVIFLI